MQAATGPEASAAIDFAIGNLCYQHEALDAAVAAIRSGVNQYPPGPGMPVLREAIARIAGAEFAPFPSGPQTFQRVVIGGEPRDAAGAEAELRVKLRLELRWLKLRLELETELQLELQLDLWLELQRELDGT